MWSKRSKREFPVEVPAYIWARGVKPEDVRGNEWIMRSEYERRQANRLIANGVVFLYESIQMGYEGAVTNGFCADCNSPNVLTKRLYTPDFYFPDTEIFVETKGKFDAPNRTKMKQVCGQGSEDIRMVFMRDNWLTRKKKMSYSRWCTINDIQYAVGDIPLEWVK